MCDPAFLFSQRRVRLLPLDRLAEIAKDPAVTSTTWYVNGVRARHKDDHSAPRWGAEPLLDYDAAKELRERPLAASAAAGLAFPAGFPPDIANAEQRSALAVLQMHQETMRRFLAVQEDLMKQFLGGAAPQGSEAWQLPEAAALPQALAARVARAGNGVNGTSTHEPAPPPGSGAIGIAAIPPVAQPPQPTAVRSDRGSLAPEDLAKVLLEIVSNRTGYPTEVLGLDMDLEAEIGIDSIKRIEILAALEPALPQGIAAEMQSRMEALTRVKTLNGLISRLLEFESRRAAPDSAPPAGLSVLAASVAADAVLAHVPEGGFEEASGCPRFVFEGRPAAPFQSDVPISGLYIVSGTGPADAVASMIESHGGAVERVSLEPLTNGVTLEHQVDDARRRHGAVRGLIHVPAPRRSRLPEALAEWRIDTQVQVKNLFALLRSCGRDIHEPDFVAIAASFMGGSFGRDGSGNADIVAAACAGILKTLAAEVPSCRVRIFDFAPDLPGLEVARIIAVAMQSRAGGTETGFGPDGAVDFRAIRRDVDRSAPPAPAAGYPFTGSKVWLVTGGARGITAQCIEALAQPGATIVATGRTPQPAVEPREYTGLSRAELRDAIMASARSQGEHIAPARIEARVADLLSQREIRSNLDRLRATGAKVEYHAVDVRDENAMNTLIASVYQRHGNIDAVIHGAGVVDDKLIADKTQASFDKVFDTKADGAFLLQKHLRGETLGLFVLFGSVSGRFGNPGQADYAAANELLNRLGWYLRRHWPHTRIVSINWGPWDSAGMANESVRRNLIRRGIMPIDRENGIRFLTGELTYGAWDEAEVVAGDGPWATSNAGEPDPAPEPGRVAGAFADVNGLGEALRRG
jgi:NAD(P)-dependent dehydrogenase (short-subunit alcohol dehydrogenase family)